MKIKGPAIKMNKMKNFNEGEALNAAQCLERILDSLSDGPVLMETEDDETEKAVKNALEADYAYVTSLLDITRGEAEIFAAALDLTIGGNPTMDNIASRMSCSSLALLGRMNEMDSLVSKRYVRTSTRGFRGTSYYVPDEVVKSIQKNSKPEGADYSGLSSMAMIRRWNRLFSEFWRDNLDVDTLRREVLDIAHGCMGNQIGKTWENKDLSSLDENIQLLVAFMLTRNIMFDDNSYSWRDYSKIFEEDPEEMDVMISMQSGENILFTRNIIEHGNSDGIVDNSVIGLTNACKDLFLSEILVKGSRADEGCRNIILSSGISEKHLFYNADEGRQVERLSSLLKKDSFDSIVARLEEKGMRKGFCCLLYGGPGTGKTETVYQIARQTGRDVFLVDVSQLKSKWVGDSEKNVRAVFQEYKSAVSRRELAPILLFNEADAIFGIRMKGAERAVDKMENSIQNIILQEMEDLEGIMIATTNLTSNFDPAFERRFIYKVNLSNPDQEARTHIWETLVEGISEQDARTLASEYDFSGGQIENISRKMTVDYILSGVQPELTSIRQLCDSETISSGRKGAAERTRIGY